MMLLVHILIALSSLAFVGFTFLMPSQRKLKVAYLSLILTLGTGAYLVVSTGSHMLEACLMGLLYVGLMAIGIAMSHVRMQQIQSHN